MMAEESKRLIEEVSQFPRETLSSTAKTNKWVALGTRVRWHTTVIRHLTEISSLDLCSYADKGSFQSLFRRRKQHLLFDLGIIRGPWHIESAFNSQKKCVGMTSVGMTIGVHRRLRER